MMTDAIARPAGRASAWRMTIVVAKLAVTAGILVWLYSKIGGGRALALLADTNLVLLGCAVALTVLQVLVGAMRWYVVLDALGHRAPLSRVTVLFTIGVFFNICVPTGVGGDAYRAWQITRAGAPISVAVNSVLIDRVLVTAVLLLAVVVEYPWVAMRFASVNFLPIFLVSAGGLAALAVLMLPYRNAVSQPAWRLLRAMAVLRGGLRRALARPLATLLSAATIAMFCMSVWLAALSIGVSLSLLDGILLVPPVMVVMLLPVTIGGWGLRESAMVIAFGAAGIAPEAGFAVSVLVGLVTMGVSLVGGVFWLASTDSGAPANRPELRQ